MGGHVAILSLQRHPGLYHGALIEIADFVAYLASPGASFITAPAWAIDGGYAAQVLRPVAARGRGSPHPGKRQVSVPSTPQVTEAQAWCPAVPLS
jgi:hypothetical protein